MSGPHPPPDAGVLGTLRLDAPHEAGGGRHPAPGESLTVASAGVSAAPPEPAVLRPRGLPPRPLAELADLVGAEIDSGVDSAGRPITSDVAVTGVTNRSGEVRPGDLYAALPGARTHGARFVGEAAARGAVAVLTDPAGRVDAAASGLPVLVVDQPRDVLGQLAARVYDDPATHLTVLGVTGTSGKTTTAYFLEAGLRAAGHVTGLVGTVETRIAGEAQKSAFTTPEAPDLQAMFAVMRERGVTAVAMEVSSHALALGRVGGSRFAVGAFTNLSQDHLDFHPDLEAYFQAKALLFDGRSAVEVVNVDDAHGRRLVRPDTVTVSAEGDPGAAWTADALEHAGDGGSAFVVHPPSGPALPATVRLPGDFNVANALLALAMLAQVGVDPAVAVDAFAAVQVPGRMERVEAGQPFLAVVDYAHKPAAVATALRTLRPVTGGRLILVLGCGGDRDRGKRPMMGAAGAEGADVLIVTDDNPRSEDPAEIRAAVLAGATGVAAADRAELLELGDRRAAVVEAVRRAGPGDTVLVAGKGHEPGQDVGGVVHPFDDRDVLRQALLAKRT